MPEAIALRLTALPAQPRLVLDPVARQVTLAGRACAIHGRAFDLLQLLGAHPGQVLGADALRGQVWPGRVVETTNLRVQIRQLRSALGAAAVRTVKGSGYALAAAAEAAPGAAALPAGPAAARPTGVDDSLIGRERALACLLGLLQDHRLVTLLGPGGVGKSRLARHALRACAGDALAWVDLAPWRADQAGAPDLVRAVAAALPAATTRPRHPAPARPGDLARAVAHWQGWLLLDNAEHLAGGPLAPLVQALLGAAPGLRVLVTSQRPLGLAGETCWRLAPLPVPTAGDGPGMAGNPAVMLLLRRAQAADQRWTAGSADWPAFADILQRLDGLPLAIELAAARLPLLGASALAADLANPLQLLGTAPHPRPGRHASLRSVVDSSMAMLSPAERQAFLALSMWVHPVCRATAAAMLCALGADRATAQQRLQALVDTSLLLAEEAPAAPGRPGTTTWLRMLSSHRAWAQEALRRQGVAACRAVHAAHARLAAGAAGAHPGDSTPWHPPGSAR